MSFLGKEYKLYKKENADGILKFLGVTDDQLEAVNSFNPPEKFTKNGDTYTYYTENEKGPAEIKFKTGVEIDYDLWDEPSKTTFVVDGNTITQTIKTDKHTSVFKREFNGDELVATFSATGYNGEVKFFYRV